MKDVTLNQKEQARLSVLNSVLEFQVPIADAAELLGVTQRHARRMLAAYQELSRKDKSKILDEFIAVTGYHRKHGIRLLAQSAEGSTGTGAVKGFWYQARLPVPPPSENRGVM